jgi:hypothetical protein
MAALPRTVPCCKDTEVNVTDFYGIQAGTIPSFAEAGGGKFMSVRGLPDRTVRNMATFMDKLRGMHEQRPAGVGGVRTARRFAIEDRRRNEGHTDPRDDRAP